MKLFNITATGMGYYQQEIADAVMDVVCDIEFESQEDFESKEAGFIIDACKKLGWHSVPQVGGLETEWEIMLMNPSTGSVGSISDWAAEGFGLDDGLIAVVHDSDGDWIEDK